MLARLQPQKNDNNHEKENYVVPKKKRKSQKDCKENQTLVNKVSFKSLYFFANLFFFDFIYNFFRERLFVKVYQKILSNQKSEL